MEQARFTIYDTTGPEPVPVGTCELVIQHRWRNAEFFILLGSGHRAKGIGTEATKLTLDYAFHITNLRNVYVTVLAPNTAGIKAYEKAGFRVIGARRQSGYGLGEPCDEILMDAIKGDFPGPRSLCAGWPGRLASRGRTGSMPDSASGLEHRQPGGHREQRQLHCGNGEICSLRSG